MNKKDQIGENWTANFQCVQVIMTEVSEKINLGLCLPKMFSDDGKLLKKFVSPKELELIQIVWQEHQKTRVPNKTPQMMDFKLTSKPNTVLFFMGNTNLNAPSFYFENFDDLLETYTRTISTFQTAELEAFCKENSADMVSRAGAEFLATFTKLKKQTINLLSDVCELSEESEEETGKLLQLYKNAKQQIIELLNILEDKKFKSEQINEEKQKLIYDYSKKLDFIKRNISKNIKKIIEKSEEKITLGIEGSEQRQKELSNTLKETEEKLTSLQEFNKTKESALQRERNIVQTELLALIDQYDTDMKKKLDEYEDLMAQYQKEQIMLVELQKSFEVQNKIYIKLMAEKKEYEQNLWDSRLLEVRRKFAARKIQKCIRNYLAVCKAKGKKYGKKKKTKKEMKK